MTTIQDARILAHVFECAARGVEIDYKQLDPHNPGGAEAQYRAVFQKLMGDIEFIKSKARSTTWKPEVVDKLNCFSVCPESIYERQKDSIRMHSRGCMGCTRTEECNYKALSLFGYCKPLEDGKSLFTSFDGLCDHYTAAFDAYNQVLIDAKDGRKHFVDGFHPQDGGMLVLGETCHNRALLYNMASNFVFNWIFIADTWIQDMREEGKKVKDSLLYVSSEEDAEAIRKSIESLKELATHETSHVSEGQLSIDAEWWRCIRIMRGQPTLVHQYYEKMGRRGLSAWSALSSGKSKSASSQSAPALAEGTTERRQSQYDFADSDDTSSSEESAPVVPSRKRMKVDPPLAEAASSSSAGMRESKRAKLFHQLLCIKEKLVASGDLADAIAIMEAVVELQG